MRNVWILLWVVGVFSSCGRKPVASDMKTLPGNWQKDEKLAFTLPTLDSLSKYDVFLHLRHNNEYPFNNIYIIAEMVFPHGRVISDTLEYRMAEPDGTWLGTGVGSIKDNKLWYKEAISFFEEGSYTLILSQAVRNNGEVNGVSQLEGILDVGYSIEETTD